VTDGNDGARRSTIALDDKRTKGGRPKEQCGACCCLPKGKFLFNGRVDEASTKFTGSTVYLNSILVHAGK
jgi:hypothetical protein